MIFINRHETDPWFNIAAEEYFLKNRLEDIVMIWQCTPAVIVGKHQNTIVEVNPEVIREQEIAVIRRLSGGGTVYHDLGNINYTVIRSEKRRDRLIDFGAFTKPIIDFLKGFGIKANFEGKNNLVVDGKKISGNSAHVHRNRVIHHGTLLFDTNLDNLDFSIKPSQLKVEDKAVQSVRAMVTNIKDQLPTEMSTNEFKEELIIHLLNCYHISKIDNISNDERDAIISLAEEKYKTRDWTYGYSPAFTIVKPIELSGLQTEIRLKVIKGLIETSSIEGQTEEIKQIKNILDKLSGLPYHPVDLDPYLRKLNLSTSHQKLFNKLFFNIL